ncbi:MAG TPA: type II toxin-antitoxin system VapC family toxin [Bryobacterales bacterium]|nr:type II toxin-antitoxin system VapC family toxin [Bryobacterales bacterium]
MGLILDTNALSAIGEGEPAAVAAAGRADQIAIPVIVLGEYEFGIARSRHRSHYERWLGEMLSVSRVLDIDEHTAARYAEIRIELKQAGAPIPSNDVWIAALCRQHAWPILTRDRHFDSVRGLERLVW